MKEEDENRGFKVEDRRRFSAEGELKPEFRGETSAEKPSETSSEAESHAQGRAAYESASQSAPRQPSEITFASFIVGLSTQAMLHLGEIPDPATGKAVRDLPAAQQLIDLIGILREKTRGNLDDEENGMLEAILFDLRMKYVELARSPST